MALDGIAVAAITAELATALIGGRIDKIHQPRADEVILSVRKEKERPKVLLSANPSNPRVHLTGLIKENPLAAPMFCMVLRKHIAGGKILSVRQLGLERILCIDIESMNELGDYATRTLIAEIMGKHSNLILVDEHGKILDSIKRISHDKSSVREVLPGRDYVLPPNQDKLDPLNLDKAAFLSRAAAAEGEKLQKFIYTNYTGISPIMASEICFDAGHSSSDWCGEVQDFTKIFDAFCAVMNKVKAKDFMPELIYDAHTHGVLEFSVLPMAQFIGCDKQFFASPSRLLEAYFGERDNTYHIRQRAHDMRRIVAAGVERCARKKELHQQTRHDIRRMDKWKRKGELLTANLYAVKQGETKVQLQDFYEEALPMVEIALDPEKTPVENAQTYFAKYNKAKRTLAALEIQEASNNAEMAYLEGILVAIDAATDAADLAEIRRELTEEGFLRGRSEKRGKEQKPKPSKPMHFVTSEGSHIYVGKSNTQNDELTLRFAEPTDLWFHTKNIPGSHVILKSKDGTATDNAILSAATLAAYYSRGKEGSQVPVDYTQRKHVKKPKGAKPGMVIYETNKTVFITPEESTINLLEKEE